MTTVSIPTDIIDAPVAIIGIDQEKIIYANNATLKLLECNREDIVNKSDWLDWMFTVNTEKWKQKILQGNKQHVSGEISTFKGNKRFIRINKNEQKNTLVLIDLTDMREDTEVLQTGYDEFINVTTELEKAFATIEKQNKMLEKQRDKLEDELKIARKVQTQVFSVDFSKFTPIRAAGFYEAMEDLGGDMWLFHQTEETFTAVIGDVMGHGVAASLISIAAKTIFQKYIESPKNDHKSLAEICTEINTEIVEITQGDYYITVGAFRINNMHEIEYITCGHPPILLYDDSENENTINQLFISQPMLGIFKDIELISHSVQLKTEDRILLFTDCLMEAFDSKGEVISPEKIYKLLSSKINKTPQDAITSILKYHDDFTGTIQRSDDLAMICVEIAANAEPIEVLPGII